MTGSHRIIQPAFALLLGAAAWAFVGVASAQEEGEDEASEAPAFSNPADAWELPDADTSNWRCRNCPIEGDWQGYAELGAGYVSEDSTEFGNYRGLEEEGAYPVAGAELLYRSPEGGYLDLRGQELGLDARSVRAETGRQGAYDFSLAYDELPSFTAGDTRTVYRGVGSGDLDLPGGWVRANNTGGMTALDASLRDRAIEQERKSLGVGIGLVQGDRWRYDLDYRQSRKEGTRIQGGSFLFRSALLPAPIDYETESVDATVAYLRDRWQVEAGYHASVFRNENESLIWDNPFTSANNADRGRLALPPDNEFHQVSLAGSWRSTETLTLAGRIAVGRMQQNETFLPATINGSLTQPALPRSSLDGEVDTRNASFRITGEPTERLSAKAELRYDERDNTTPRDTYTKVVTDEFVGGSQVNTPYGYEKIGADVTLDYDVTPDFTLAGSGGREETDRNFQEVSQTQTDTYWIEARGMATERLHARIRQTREQRDGAYRPLGLLPPEHPDLRKYHIAERERDATRLAVDYMMSPTVSIGGSFELAEDDYTDSDIGLTEARERSMSFNVSALAAEGVTTYAFAAVQSIRSEVRGQDNVTGAPWVADLDDDFGTLGIGVEFADLPWGFTKGGLDLTYGTGRGEIDIRKTGATTQPLPDVRTRLYTLDLHADHPIGESTDLRIGYLLERFDEDDFQHDDVDPDTIPTVLTLGQGSPGYRVHVLQLALRYRF